MVGEGLGPGVAALEELVHRKVVREWQNVVCREGPFATCIRTLPCAWDTRNDRLSSLPSEQSVISSLGLHRVAFAVG